VAGCLLKEEEVASWAKWLNGPAALLGWQGKERRERWVGCIRGLGRNFKKNSKTIFFEVLAAAKDGFKRII
jgi:hypothetical protein